ncbi:transcriptional regulator [Bacillus sp. HMF5848]|uniref:ArsR/SmtB family transcription factor n=1 Tax=Bacillus sp. HMF5848 TaxID=2495421 RepID=UPI000F782BAC|nr:metalloregulator ArsR/SmtB family transcription factor [Bacillus sp. HMF5848]RSK26772.1 transcriptional regulator [Bacillus sp. HMF5848]
MSTYSSDSCEIYCYDEVKVKHVQHILEQEDALGIAKIFKVLADENRTKIVIALSYTEELCVCDIANIIGTSVATASHHLRTLKSYGLAKYRKDGKLAFYSLDDDHVKQLIDVVSTHRRELIDDGTNK